MSRVIRPEPFDGNSSIKKWLQKYEVCAQANGWNSGEMAVQLLPLLSGTAFDFAMRLPSEEQKSYNALTKRLLLEFEAPGLQQSYALEFSDRSRRPGESLTVFLYELEQLAARAYPDWDETYRQFVVRDRFLMGLDRPLRKQVMLNMKDGDTVQSLLQIAKRVEQIDETEQKVEKAVRRVEGLEDAQPNQEITVLSQQLSAVQAQVNRISGRRKGPNELGAVPKDRRICWTCGGDDHLRRNCPYNRRGRPSRGNYKLQYRLHTVYWQIS